MWLVFLGVSSKLKGFGYLYNQKHFITSLSDDVRVVRLLPKKMRSRDSMRTLVVKTPSQFASVDFYMDEVLPHLQSQGACGLVLSGGSGLQVHGNPVLVTGRNLKPPRFTFLLLKSAAAAAGWSHIHATAMWCHERDEKL